MNHSNENSCQQARDEHGNDLTTDSERPRRQGGPSKVRHGSFVYLADADLDLSLLPVPAEEINRNA